MFAAGPSARYSQKWGWSALQDVDEADRAVEECAHREHRALGHAIAPSRLLQVLDNRFVADAENCRYLPVGLAARGPDHAVTLPVRKPRRRTDRSAHPPEAPRGLE